MKARLAGRGNLLLNDGMEVREIVARLEEIGTLLELMGENPFKVRAYQSGARTLESLEEDLDVLIEEDRLGEVKGIGKAWP